MLFIISLLGVIGAVVLGLVGLARGDAGELERILAIACFAMAAAGLVGRSADTPKVARTPHHLRVGVTAGDLLSAIAIAPTAALCVVVFLLTLLPAIYVMLPVFAIWWFGSQSPRGRALEPAPARVPEHAVA